MLLYLHKFDINWPRSLSKSNKGKFDRAVVAERSNASVYLIIDTLELKVEGSNPGVSIF